MIKFFKYFNEFNKEKRSLLKSIDRVLVSGQFILGPEVKKFENAFSKFIGTKYGVGVGNCTDAIYICLKALNIGKGDEVITAANTAIPTITAIINSGAKPKLVDINENYLIDHKKIPTCINKKTKAIIPVHLYGQTCDMNEILKISKKYKLKFIEDCAQSTGSKFNGKRSGSFGDFGCFSFYPTKVLGGVGDGGFITTNNLKLYKRVRNLRYMGMETNKDSKLKYKNMYYAYENGTNSRLDEIQAAILSCKLKEINKLIKIRQSNAKLYFKMLKNSEIILPRSNQINNDTYYEFVVSHKNRDKIIKHLKKNNINVKITYPYPIHKMQAYKKYGSKKVLKKTEYLRNKIFSLPI